MSDKLSQLRRGTFLNKSCPRNQITPPSQRLGGAAVFAIVLQSRIWKHCGSKRVRNRDQINELARRAGRISGLPAEFPAGRRKPTIS
jgi:hypothetical protein